MLLTSLKGNTNRNRKFTRLTFPGPKCQIDTGKIFPLLANFKWLLPFTRGLPILLHVLLSHLCLQLPTRIQGTRFIFAIK